MSSQSVTNIANAIINKINSLISSHNSDSNAHQDIRASIPSATSELNNNSGFITSSSVPNASSATPLSDTQNGSAGTGVTWARNDHIHPKSSIYAESIHAHSIEDTDLFDVLDCINTNFTYFTTQYLFDYLTDISNYYAQSLPNDTMGCGSTDNMSVTENDELLISDYQTRVFHNNTFTSSNHYVLELDLKKPSGIYAGADFEVMIGEPSKYIKFDSGYYGEFIHYLLEENGTPQEVSYQTTSDRFTDYFTLRITRNGNAWRGEWIVNDTVLRTLEATTPLDISNKLGFCSYSWLNYNSDELYVKNIKITDLESDVNSLNTSILNVIYPIGSIYMSVNSTNPSTLFGGTWEKIKDTFLLASGDVYSNGAAGGEATHTLTVNEMPSHRHSRMTQPQGFAEQDTRKSDIISPASGSANKVTKYSDYTGGGQAHNNMPPYFVVNVWKRTA